MQVHSKWNQKTVGDLFMVVISDIVNIVHWYWGIDKRFMDYEVSLYFQFNQSANIFDVSLMN